MSIQNSVRLTGNIGSIFNADMSGNKPYKFLLIVNDYWKNERGEVEEYANPIVCSIWGKRGEALSKNSEIGTELHIEGRLRVTQYENRFYTEVVIEDYTYGRRPKAKTESQANKGSVKK